MFFLKQNFRYLYVPNTDPEISAEVYNHSADDKLASSEMLEFKVHLVKVELQPMTIESRLQDNYLFLQSVFKKTIV